MNLKLIKIKNESTNIKTFVFEPDEKLIWKAGQYLIVSLNHDNSDLRGKMRFLTISASPFEKHPAITTRITSNSSSFKKALADLKIGEKISAKGPEGDLIINDSDKNYIFIAEGIGITPLRAIIKQLDFEQKTININLLYINKTYEIPFKNELEEIAKKNNEFKIHYFINSDEINKKTFTKLTKDLKKNIYYISGKEITIEAIKKYLKDLGVPKNNIKEDYFLGYKNI